jgi:predicted TIM-barrel fold metal-dependent hydrolase
MGRPVDRGRREALKHGGALALAALGGCACPLPSLPLGDELPALLPGPLAPPPAKDGSLELPVVIDAHCHIFNVEDVPACPFLKGPVAHQYEKGKPYLAELIKGLADVVSAIAYFLAPSARQEIGMLEDLSAKHRAAIATQSPAMARKTIDEAIAKKLDDQVRKFTRAFSRAAEHPSFAVPYREHLKLHRQPGGVTSSTPGQSGSDASTTPDLAYELSEEKIYKLLTERDTLTPSSTGVVHPDSVIYFAFSLTAPRYLNLWLLQRTYSGGHGCPAVDVLCPSQLDLNHWLGCDETATAQNDQVRLLEQIAIMSGGTILPFVAYNPRTDLKHDGASFARVVDAISNRGFIGVKIYPPMGYRPYGNAPQPGAETCPVLEYGSQIDERLGQVYAWCLKRNVPVMAHTSYSFGSTFAHDECAAPLGWDRALERYSGLRVQAGHFGGDSEHALKQAAWAAQYVRMMGTPRGEHLYADLSNLVELFESGSQVQEVIEPLILRPLSDGSARVVADRLVYGSDWYMTELTNVSAAYLCYMEAYLRGLETKYGVAGIRERVLGRNAAQLYGLVPDPECGEDTNWSRLKRYYANKGIPTPAWMGKIAASCDAG